MKENIRMKNGLKAKELLRSTIALTVFAVFAVLVNVKV